MTSVTIGPVASGTEMTFDLHGYHPRVFLPVALLRGTGCCTTVYRFGIR